MIIITGASDGLGLQLAKLYKSAGKKVVSISRRECEYADYSIVTDLSISKEVTQAVQKVVDLPETIEALVNCAGVLYVQKLPSIDPQELHNVLAVNVQAAILLVSGLAERLKNDGADIVNVASTVGFKGYVDQAAYGASKWALRGFSANLQVEFKDTACRVISFCPGGFKSRLFEKATGNDNTNSSGEWMNAADIALFMKQILDLPKNMEVSEVVINRKQVK